MLQDYVGVLDMRPADESTAATPNDRSIVNDRGNMIPGTIGGGTITTVAKTLTAAAALGFPVWFPFGVTWEEQREGLVNVCPFYRCMRLFPYHI